MGGSIGGDKGRVPENFGGEEKNLRREEVTVELEKGSGRQTDLHRGTLFLH